MFKTPLNNQYGKFLYVITAYCAVFSLFFLREFFKMNKESHIRARTPHVTNQGLH